MKPIYSSREIKAYGAWMYAHLNKTESCVDGIDVLGEHIIACIDYLQKEAALIAQERGYFEHPSHLLPFALTHRVIEECMELAEVYARRREEIASDKIAPFTRAEEEWADCVIKLMRISGLYGYRPAALIAKLKYEKTRETTRGGKLF